MQIIVTLLVFALTACGGKSGQPQGTIKAGGRIIKTNFILKDGAGAELTLEQFKGKVILLNFWTSWVVSTPSEFQLLKKLCSEFKHPDFIVVSVSLDDPYSDNFRKFTAKSDVNFNIYISPSSANNAEILRNFPEIEEKIPCYYLLTKNLQIKKYTAESLNVESMIKEIKECLND